MKKIATIIFILLCSVLSFAQLSGDYYIPQGANPQGFATLADAIISLNTNGCLGTVYFYIDGDLAETGANLVITRNDLSATNNLTIKPAPTKTPTITISGCTNTAGANQYSGMALYDADYITIDGSNTVGGTTKDLSYIMNDATNGRNIIQLYGNCDNVTIKNTNVTYQAPMSTANSTRGIYLNGQATGVADNFTVQNCNIGDATNTPYYALGLTGSSGSITYCTYITVKDNNLYGRIRPVYFYYVGTSGTSCEISNNYIYTYGGLNGTTTYTIMFNTWAGTINIFNNKLPTITTNNTATSGIYGISGLSAQTGATCNIYNNFIGGDLSFTGTGVPTVISLMYLQDNGTYLVYYNSFNYPSITNNTERSCIHISGTSANVTLKDNILINSTDATNAYCIWKSNGTLTSDYNDLYVSGTNANIGYVGAAAKHTLADWQASGYDANSKSKAVTFTSATDLHLSGGSIGDNDLTGTVLGGYTTDLDGDTRGAYWPYMGADENTVVPLHPRTPGTIPMTTGVSNALAFGANGVLGTDGSATFYTHWDATYLYLGWSGGKTNYSSDLYYAAIDIDPDGTNGTNNAIEGVSFLAGGPRPDFYVVYENNSSFYGSPVTNGNAFEIYNVSGGNWNWVSRTDGDDGTSSQIDFLDASGEVRLRIPWATLGFTPATGTKLGIVMWDNNSDGNYMWARVPTTNPANGGTPKVLDHQFVYNNTGDGVNPSSDRAEGMFPVELTSFNSLVHGKDIQLNWHTATEVKSYGFSIERRTKSTGGGEEWSELGFINATGNSNSPKQYSFTDENVAEGKYIYRLKMIDNDGTYEYSNEVEAEVAAPNKFELAQNYPNPFNPSTKIQYSIPVDSKVLLEIYSISGEKVVELVNEFQPTGSYTVEFNAGKLASGTYLYRIVAGNFVQVKKLMLMK